MLSPVHIIKEHKKSLFIGIGGIVCIFIVTAVSVYAYTKVYEGRVLPNVYIGVVDVGELSRADASQVLRQHVDALLSEGVTLRAENQTGKLTVRSAVLGEPDLAHELIYFDTEALLEEAMEVGRNEGFARNIIRPIQLLFSSKIIFASPELNKQNLEEQILTQFEQLEEPSIPADYAIDLSGESPNISFVPGVDGKELNTHDALITLQEDASDLTFNTLEIALIDVISEMTQEDALSLQADILEAIEHAPYTFSYSSQTLRQYSWKVRAQDLALWLEPVYETSEDGEQIPVLGFGGESWETFVRSLSKQVEVKPVDARFVMENARVTEFRGSQEGIELDTVATMKALMDEFGKTDTRIEIVVVSTPPDIATEDVNSFGIKDVLGTGVSDFSGSPSNRIANIQHGAAKLNGMLIAPGETISLVQNLKPFTVADGYLPELVIKGDEIKPEVGGGLCQIGTTAFRAVMNAGLQVDERRNHSLVVSYYNDPLNGNPGTDATIYDPYPDFKFTNNYANYILLTTSVDVTGKEVIFTFWGTDDGRRGYYSAPAILSWTGYGETQYTQTTSLQPGVTQCQSPHPGATARFTYYVDYADGTQFSETYTSVYRSLPRICLVGVETLSEETNTDEDCETCESESEQELAVEE